MATNQQTSPQNVIQALLRHKGKAALFFISVTTATLAALLLSPKTYHSEGKLFIRLGRANTTLDPTAGAGSEPLVVVPNSREEEINSVVEILGSRAMMEKVVDALGPEVLVPASAEPAAETEVASIGPAEPREEASGRKPLFGGIKIGTTLTAREQAVLLLSDHVAVQPVRKSSVIVVSYNGRSPEVCQKVVACWIEAYLQEHLRLNQTTGVREFFVEQKKQSADALAEAQERLRELKNTSGLASPDKQRELLVERIARLKDELFATSEQLAVAEKQVAWLRERLAATPESEMSSKVTGVGDHGTDIMREQLYVLRLREEEMKAKYTEEHPKMRAMREQGASAREILSQEKPTRVQTTTGPSKTYEALQLELVKQEPVLASLSAQAEMLRGELAAARDDLKALNQAEVQVADLQREVELHETNYRKYAADLEQARIDDALESDRISNISVAQPATLEPMPVGPSKRMILLLAMIAGLGGAVGLAVMSEYFNPTIRTPEEVERVLDLPMLASIPRLGRRQLALNGKGNGHGG